MAKLSCPLLHRGVQSIIPILNFTVNIVAGDQIMMVIKIDTRVLFQLNIIYF